LILDRNWGSKNSHLIDGCSITAPLTLPFALFALDAELRTKSGALPVTGDEKGRCRLYGGASRSGGPPGKPERAIPSRRADRDCGVVKYCTAALTRSSVQGEQHRPWLCKNSYIREM
jgi:hypothetical protein